LIIPPKFCGKRNLLAANLTDNFDIEARVSRQAFFETRASKLAIDGVKQVQLKHIEPS